MDNFVFVGDKEYFISYEDKYGNDCHVVVKGQNEEVVLFLLNSLGLQPVRGGITEI